ncbi:hypothetical protein AAFN85_13675 [Mucilaginibacter sp. CAU 1740]|uniref:hypothetical protein n=1 Tax=Mucilaginibacter sp. CAU 1740 TaxID=3140365 RepID=UPI00325AD016
MKDTELEGSYQLNGSADIVMLKVTVGFGQLAQTSVSIDAVPLVTEQANEDGNYENSFEIPLGTNADLAGKHLSILPAVAIIQEDEHRTSVQIELVGSDAPSDFRLLKEDQSKRGDVVDYSGQIDLLGA